MPKVQYVPKLVEAGVGFTKRIFVRKEEQLSRKEAEKTNKLQSLVVTVSTGKKFYADPESRVDLSDAVSGLAENGLTETKWKLAEPIPDVPPVEGTEKIYVVTIDELREARDIALLGKGEIVGAV